MSDDLTPNPPSVHINITRSPDFRYLSANNIRMRVSQGDFTLIFGYLDDTSVGPIVTELTSLSMTPVMARRVAVLLNEMIGSYETKFGPIGRETEMGIDGADIMRRVEAIVKGETP